MEYEYSTNDPAVVAAIMTPIMLISLVLAVIMIIALWKIFTKAGEPGWAAIVPIYNAYVEFKIAGMNPWMFLLLFVPIANIVVAIIVALKLGERFGKGGAWSFFLLILIPIGYLILAFGKAQYSPPVTPGRYSSGMYPPPPAAGYAPPPPPAQ
jgi:hypothetical protein